MKKILLALFILSTQLSHSQRVVSLEECKSLALESNKTLKQKELEVDIAQQQQKEAFTKYFPHVSASALYFSTTSPMLSADLSTSSLSALGLPLPSTIAVGMIDKGAVASLSATQVIYGGGLIRNSNRLASLGVQMRQLQHSLSSDEITLRTEEIYWQCVMLCSNHKTLTSAIAQCRELKEHIESAVNAGVTNRNDLLRTELELSKLEGDELKLRNAQLISQLVLAQQIGLTHDSFEVLDIQSTPIREPHTYYIDPGEAIASDKQLNLLGKQQNIHEIERKMAQGERLPKVAAAGAWSYNNLLGDNNDFFVGMATVTVPISDWWGGSHKIRSTKLREQQSQLEYDNAVQQIEIQLEQLYLNLTQHYNQISICNLRVTQAQENLRLNMEHYNAGTTTLINVLEARTLLQHSQGAVVEATIGYNIALSRYLQKKDD